MIHDAGIETKNHQVEIISWDDVRTAILDPGHRVSLITAPNFEERSNALISDVCGSTIGKNPGNRWHIVTFQGANEHDIRDYIKSRNCNLGYELLLGPGLCSSEDVILKSMALPAVDHEVRALLSSATEGMGKDFTLIIDISSIPRAFLWRLIDTLTPYRFGFNAPSRLWLVYGWAEGYSETLEFETTGQIVDFDTDRTLEEIVEKSRSLDAVVFTSGNVRNAFMTVEAISHTAHQKDFFVEIVHFIRPRGFSRSWHQLRMHNRAANALSEQISFENSYVFHVEHALSWMRDLGKKSLRKLREAEDHIFVIAPNGPKILAILAQFVADEYINTILGDDQLMDALARSGRSAKDCVAILSTQSSQFLSVYSLGVDGEFSCASVKGL